MQLTKSELQIMDVLWDSPLPMGRQDFMSTDHQWKNSSVHILINGLLKKKAIKVYGIVPAGKTFARQFAPAISREQYWAQLPFAENGEKVLPELLIAEILHYAGFVTSDPMEADLTLQTALNLFNSQPDKEEK